MKDSVTKTCEKSRPSRARGRSNYNKASKVFGVSVTSAHRDSIREMECTERALFIEIYCSLVSLAHFIILSLYFDFFKTHSILSLFRCWWIWCLIWNWEKVLGCALYIFHFFGSHRKLIWKRSALSCIKYGKGKYQCTADLLFDWFGFDQTSKSLSNSTQAKQINPSK